MRVWPGNPYPLGVVWDGAGVNVAVFSENAEAVDLCLFDSPYATQEFAHYRLPVYTDNVWHGYFPDLQLGQVYGFRVRGPFRPEQGLRFNSNKILLDPYARQIARPYRYHESLLASRLNSEGVEELDPADSAAVAPLAKIYGAPFDWQGDIPLRIPWQKTVLYECHIKGMTQLHPEVPEQLRGKFLGLCSEPIIAHLKSLSISAVELMPVHFFCDERAVAERGMGNYWGYNSIGYFAPDPRYALPNGDPVAEFKQMVRTFHRAGIEVILDVVYNHTAEGNEFGPTVSFRGIDNSSYYRLKPEDSRRYLDFTGCGNTLNLVHPQVLQLVMDSLRYWITEMHVDGFRFDLASALARESFAVDRFGSFFDAIHQDPVVSRVKLIAEPWDLGDGGYQVGNFPVLWTEWNGKYRDSVRSFWSNAGDHPGEFATRVAGNSDIYLPTGKTPHASLNFITAHDGFTLEDLVSYQQKHNEENGEENRDGTNDNRSWNCGVEGPSSSPDILARRDRQKRNLMATLFLSLGVPMISGGDELSRSQGGNNNRYCHDDERNWYHWELNDGQRSFLTFLQRLSRLRAEQPVLQRRTFFTGALMEHVRVKDVTWYGPLASELKSEDWQGVTEPAIMMCVSGEAINETDNFGVPIVGDTLLIVYNGSRERADVIFPEYRGRSVWELLFSTGLAELTGLLFQSGELFHVPDLSVTVFRLVECYGAD